MGKSPGFIAFVDPYKNLLEKSGSTHTLSLNLLSWYLYPELKWDIYLLGIQPERLGMSSQLSTCVQRCALQVFQVCRISLSSSN